MLDVRDTAFAINTSVVVKRNGDTRIIEVAGCGAKRVNLLAT